MERDDAPGMEQRLGDLGRLIDSARSAGEAERAARLEAERDALLASDSDRDRAVESLSEAFSDGRLTSAELEERTTRALQSRTHGELDDVLHGLVGAPDRGPRHIGRKVAFWAATVVGLPFVLLGVLTVPFGVDTGDRWGGLVLLLLFLPPLYALNRWAWPRR